MEFLHVLTAHITHSGTKSAEHLIYGVWKHTLIRYSSFNAFRNKLLVVTLEISVCTSSSHSSKTSHSSICFKLTSLINFVFSRRFLTSGNKRTYHNNVCSGGKSFNNVSWIFYSAVSYNLNSIFFCQLSNIINSRNLRNTYSRNNSCCTYRTWSDSNLYTVRSGFNQSFSSLCCCHVSRYKLNIWKCLFNSSNGVNYVYIVSMSRV